MTEELRLTPQPQGFTNGGQRPELEPPAAVPGSIVARLREQAKQQHALKRKDIVVGGEFKDHLWIRYKPLPPEEMDSFVARGVVNPAKMEFTLDMMDMMSRCCVEIIGRYGDEEVTLSDADGPIRLEHRLAVLLDMPRGEDVMLTSHEVIKLLFGNNGPLLGEHGGALMTWMTGKANEEEEPGE